MTASRTMDTPDAAQRGAADPTASVWVAASAGTGKTKVLTDRVLNLMLTGTPAQRILCLTFTKAAAAEMNERIARDLSRWAAVSDSELERHIVTILGREPDDGERRLARQLFPRVLDTPGGLGIHTIHAFCQSVLGRFPLEAGVAPHFAVLDERDQAELMAVARDRVLIEAERQADDTADNTAAETAERPVGCEQSLTAAVAEVTRHVHEGGFTELFGHLAASRARIAAIIERCGSLAAAVAAVYTCLGVSLDEAPDTVTAAACADATLDELGLRLCVSALQGGTSRDKARGETMERWLAASLEDRLRLFEAYTDAFLTQDNATRQPRVKSGLITKSAAKSCPGAREILQTEAERLLAAEMKLRAVTTARATAALLVLGEALVSTYQRLKEERSVLDYDDLITRTALLLERQGGVSWVHFKLDGGIDHVLIDEAQDTSPEQWRIIRALTGEFFAGEGARQRERTMFAVGDVKQSIFSFQGADPDQFADHRDWFGQLVRSAGHLWRPFSLQTSFRSTRAVLDAVDAVFAGDGAADGVNLDGEPIVHRAYRQLDGGAVEVWPPVLPRESDDPPPWRPPIERVRGDSPEVRLAVLIAERVAEMIAHEMLESTGRPVLPGDIMVLVRRRTPFVEELVRQLKNRHVAVAGIDRMILTEQMAVMDLMALARFALLPGDDLTLATVLKGPLIGLDEDQLFRLAYGREGSLWARLRALADDDPTFADARERLSAILAMADTVAPFAFFATILGPHGGRRRLLARLGRDAEDPLAEFLDLALSFERIHAPSLHGFLHWLEASAVEIKRDLEQAPQAVRVMTVHGAKGLQAPVVFLPDTMQVPRRIPPLLWPPDMNGGEGLLWPPFRDACEDVAALERDRCAARQQQEYRRLLYVAMTRAADRLIVCGWRGPQPERDSCWYRMIVHGLKSAGHLHLDEVEDGFLAARGETDGATVLRLSCPQTTPPDAQEVVVSPPVPPLPAWATVAPPAEPEPPRPLSPSRPDDDEPPVRSPTAGGGVAARGPSRGPDHRPDRGPGYEADYGTDHDRGFRRGRLVHRLLQSLPSLAPPQRASTARVWLSRPVHRISRETADEIVAEVMAVLEAPEWADLFGPDSRAEVPLTGVVGNRVVSGQMDRLLIAEDAITVLDFKSDRTPPQQASEVPLTYYRQMAAYRAVLQAMHPNRLVRCALLWTHGPRIMPLDPSVLDRFAPGRDR